MRECRESFPSFFFLSIFFLHYFQKNKKKRLYDDYVTSSKNGLRSRPRIINTFWYNNDFFFTRNKEIGKCMCFCFFVFSYNDFEMISIDLVRIFFSFLLCSFLGGLFLQLFVGEYIVVC